jgi:hypothetical protein
MSYRRMEEWRYSSFILDLGTRCRWVVSFTLQRLYPRRTSSLYPFNRRLGGPQNLDWRLWRWEKPCPCRQSNPVCPARSPSLHRLSYPGYMPLLYLGLVKTFLTQSGGSGDKRIRKRFFLIMGKWWLHATSSYNNGSSGLYYQVNVKFVLIRSIQHP